MSKALKKCQREDGFWNVSLHDPTNFGGNLLHSVLCKEDQSPDRATISKVWKNDR